MKISVKAIPNAKKPSLAIEKDDDGKEIYKIKVNRPPESGRANEAITEILAEHFEVKKSEVKLVRGTTSRHKIFEIR